MATDSLERETRAAPAARPTVLLDRGRRRLPGAAGWTGFLVRAALPTALLLWLVALRGVHLERMGSLGLFQALPPLYWAAVLVLTAGFVLALRSARLRPRWAPAYVLGLIVLIHATPSLLYPTLRYSWAWKHVVVVDAMIRQNGAVPNAGDLNIYNHWPGFFELNALFLRATGLPSALGYASWFPLAANLLLLGPLLLLYRTVTRDQRLVWGGIWVYYSASWVGQDYFAPQAFAYLLFVLVLGLVLRQLSVTRTGGRGSGGGGGGSGGGGPGSGPGPESMASARAMSWVLDAPRRGGWRPAPFVLLLVLIAGIVTTHPLTPMMLISVLIMLSLPRGNRRVVLPVLAAAVALTFAWDNTVARPYIAENLNDLIVGLSAGDQNVRPAGQTKLGAVDPEQVLASYLAWATTGTVLLLAGIALLRYRGLRHSGLPLALFAPVPLLLGNSYGGEMVLRAYLFMLPAAALLAAAALLPGIRSGAVGRAGTTGRLPRTGPVVRLGWGAWLGAPGRLGSGTVRVPRVPRVPRGGGPAAGRVRETVAAGVMLALLGGMFCGYYTKESMNYFTPREVAAVQYLNGVALAGSRVVSVSNALPGGQQRYDQHDRVVMTLAPVEDQRKLIEDPLTGIRNRMAEPAASGPSFLILSRAQIADCRLTGLLPADTVGRVAAAVAGSPDFQLVFSNQDAAVYRLVHSAPATAGPGGGSATP